MVQTVCSGQIERYHQEYRSPTDAQEQDKLLFKLIMYCIHVISDTESGNGNKNIKNVQCETSKPEYQRFILNPGMTEQ